MNEPLPIDPQLQQAAELARQTYFATPDAASHQHAVESAAKLAFAHAEAGDINGLIDDLNAMLRLDAINESSALLSFLHDAVGDATEVIAALGNSLLSLHQTSLAGSWPALNAYVKDCLREAMKAPCETQSLWINLTSRCNLRCVYCSVGKPGHIDQDIPPESLDKIMDFIRHNRPSRVMVGCYTETTSYEGWTEVIRAIIDTGTSINVITNMARQFDSDEIDTLAHCTTLQTSIDTMDRERLKEVRKGADIRTILYNIVRIRARAIELGITPPQLEWICVPTQENFASLMEYVASASACGVSTITINPVLQFQDAKQKFPDLLDFPDTELREVFNRFEEAAALARAHNIAFNFISRDLILERLNNPTQPAPTRGGLTAALGKVTFYAHQLPAGTTRLCTQPWNNVVLSDKGELYPCTICGVPMAKLEDYANLEEALHSPGVLEWKRNLLAGTPDKACVNCFRAPQGSTQELEAMVAQLPPRTQARMPNV